MSKIGQENMTCVKRRNTCNLRQVREHVQQVASVASLHPTRRGNMSTKRWENMTLVLSARVHVTSGYHGMKRNHFL